MDTKFSDFVPAPFPNGSENVVGYTGTDNIKMTVDSIRDPDNTPGWGSSSLLGDETLMVKNPATSSIKSIETNKLRDFIKGYKSAFILVNTSSGDALAISNDFAGVTFAYSNPSNGTIRVTASSAIFTAGKTFTLCGGGADGGGVPYIVCAFPTNTTFCTIKLYKFDGTLTATPFVAVPLEIRVYP